MRTIALLRELSDALPRGAFYYLGSPYTNCPLGRERAFELARDVSLHLQARDIANYLPIIAGHHASRSARIPLDDDAFWWAANRPYAVRAHGLIVLRLKGWRESRGLAVEMTWFNGAGKPVLALRPSLALGRERHAGERNIADGLGDGGR